MNSQGLCTESPYYEPRFSGRSHGFRPGRGCHTALREAHDRLLAEVWRCMLRPQPSLVAALSAKFITYVSTVGVVLIVVTTAVAACSNPDAYTGIDRAVADVNPEELGSVVFDERTGSGRPLSEPAGRNVAVLVEGTATEAESRVSSALERAGFESVGINGWERTKEGYYVGVGVTVQRSGTRISWTHDLVPDGKAALLLVFSRST